MGPEFAGTALTDRSSSGAWEPAGVRDACATAAVERAPYQGGDGPFKVGAEARARHRFLHKIHVHPGPLGFGRMLGNAS